MKIKKGTVIKDIKNPNEAADYLAAGWQVAEPKGRMTTENIIKKVNPMEKYSKGLEK